MVDFLSGLLTVAGGVAKEGGDAVQVNAVSKMKENALQKREERLAKLNEQYSIRAESRKTKQSDKEYERGLLQEQTDYERKTIDEQKRHERDVTADSSEFDRRLESQLKNTQLEQDIKDKAKDPLLKMRDSLTQMGLSAKEANATTIASIKVAGDTALDKAEQISKINKLFLDSVAQGIEPTDEQKKWAYDQTWDLINLLGFGVNRKGLEGGKTSLQKLVAQLNESTKSIKEPESEPDVSIAGASEKGLLSDSTNDFGAGIDAFVDSIKSSIKGHTNAINEWAKKKRQRFEPGGSLSNEPSNFSGTSGN